MYLGIDFGGTNLRMAIVDDNMKLTEPCMVKPSRLVAEAERPVPALAELIQEHLKDAPCRAVSIGMPASVADDFCTVLQAPNVKNAIGQPVFDGVALGSLLKDMLGIPVFVNKDTNNLLYYDMRAFNVKGTVVGCYIGTGIGSAVSFNGDIMYGAHGLAMDCGHMPMFHAHGICGCGKEGCAETIGSGTVLARMRAKHFPQIPFEKLFSDCKTEACVQSFLKDCAYLPATLLTVFDPHILVLGGGVLESADFPREQFKEEILNLTEHGIAANPPQICWSERLPERGVIGAAIFAEKCLQQ